MKKILITIALSFILSTPVFSETDQRKYSQGQVFIEIKDFNEKEKTNKEIIKLKKCATCPGIDNFLPFTESTKMWLVVRNDKFFFPSELITGLYNLHIGSDFIKETFTVKETKTGVIVKVSGGDGSASYDAEFDINLIDMLVKRKIYQYPNKEKPEIKTGNIKYSGKAP